MELDIFFSISQTEVDGVIPDERTMFANFFEQADLADRLGFGTAWVAESHLSTEVQKSNSGAVIPHFTGEIGLNTDILQLAHRVFARTKRIGSRANVARAKMIGFTYSRKSAKPCARIASRLSIVGPKLPRLQAEVRAADTQGAGTREVPHRGLAGALGESLRKTRPRHCDT